MVNTSIEPAEVEKHEVRWIDADGTILKRELVDTGDSVTMPEDPNYDPEYLEFDRWISTGGDINNVTKDIDFGAYYRPKEVTIDGVTARATILKARFTEKTGLTVQLQSMAGPSASTPLKVDWGDGSISTVTSSSTKPSHTYDSYGEYVIIDHHDGTITLYAHMQAGSRKVDSIL